MKLQYTMEAINRLLRGCSSRNERELVCSDASRHRSIAHHRTSSRCCNRTTTSSALAHRAPLRRILLWLFVLAIGILSQAAISIAQQDTAISDSISSTTHAITEAATVTEAEIVAVFLDPNAGPPVLNIRKCLFDTVDQVVYICRDHPDMVPLLQYVESMAKDECEKQFENELWNCSEFSLLKIPKINDGVSETGHGHVIQPMNTAKLTIEANIIIFVSSSTIVTLIAMLFYGFVLLLMEKPKEEGSEVYTGHTYSNRSNTANTDMNDQESISTRPWYDNIV